MVTQMSYECITGESTWITKVGRCFLAYSSFQGKKQAYEITFLSVYVFMSHHSAFEPVNKYLLKSVGRLCHWRWPRHHTFNTVGSTIPKRWTNLVLRWMKTCTSQHGTMKSRMPVDLQRMNNFRWEHFCSISSSSMSLHPSEGHRALEHFCENPKMWTLRVAES
jgi:hypothetical protein